MAGPRRRDALRRPVARAGGAIIPRVTPDDVPRHRGHCCRADDEPAGDARRVAELGLPLLMAARHELHRRRPLPAWRCVRSGPLHPLAAGAVSVESPPSTYPLRDHAVVVTRGTDPRSPAWLRGFPTGAHWQCRRRPPAVGRIRRSHCVDPLAAGVARRDT